MSTVTSDHSLKMVRETLCVAQHLINAFDGSGRKDANSALLQDLINDIDRQRPLGADGKHGDRHTPTCGCEDVPMSAEWREAFCAENASASDDTLKHPLVRDVVDEQMGNLNREDALARYGLNKIAMYAAQVSRAQALGVDPDILRNTDGEYVRHVFTQAARLTGRGVPVVIVTTDDS